jgi:hypothetical protein
MARSSLACVLVLSVSLAFALPVTIAAQQGGPPPPAFVRNPQALSLLQQSFAAMGGTLPSDSTATGTVTIVEGSRTETGVIKVLTKGVEETLEDIQADNDHRALIYSHLQAADTKNDTTTLESLQLAGSSECPDFPLPLIAWAITKQDAALVYVGSESIAGEAVQHIRIWNGFISRPRLQYLAEFTVRDLWMDSTTFLPRRISFSRRGGGSHVPSVSVAFNYANYQNVNGVFYPFQIQKNLNGTLWTTITISTVTLNSGLSDSEFTLPKGSNQ